MGKTPIAYRRTAPVHRSQPSATQDQGPKAESLKHLAAQSVNGALFKLYFRFGSVRFPTPIALSFGTNVPRGRCGIRLVGCGTVESPSDSKSGLSFAFANCLASV